MKVKVLTRAPSEYLRETKHDIHKVTRNYDPKLHPFEVPREYQRALNAVKLDKIFAKPYLASLDGHSDVVQTLMRHPTCLSVIVSGACDGEIKIWNISTRKCTKSINAHKSLVRSLCVPQHGRYFFSADDTGNIKQWGFDRSDRSDTTDDVGENNYDDEPINTIIAKSVIMGMDHHYTKPLFMTCGESIDLWEETRVEALRTYHWGHDTVVDVKFNPIQTDISAACASDRSIILYDTRRSEPLRKVTLEMRTNSLCWNPMEAFVFTAANEDYDLYTFDMRNLRVPIQLHKDHVSAVISIDYSPTGKEFVSGSYDKTIRIFPVDKGRSREVYHTKRMQRLTSVLWSADNKYILSGSDEMDIRIWKSSASEKLGVKAFREDTMFKYQSKLKEKFENHPQIKRIARHRHVPKHIYHAQKEKRLMLESRKRKEANRRSHSKPGTIPFTSERTKHILKEDE